MVPNRVVGAALSADEDAPTEPGHSARPEGFSSTDRLSADRRNGIRLSLANGLIPRRSVHHPWLPATGHRVGAGAARN